MCPGGPGSIPNTFNISSLCGFKVLLDALERIPHVLLPSCSPRAKGQQKRAWKGLLVPVPVPVPATMLLLKAALIFCSFSAFAKRGFTAQGAG